MTAQIHELLIFDGEAMSMAYCPPIIVDHPRIVERETYLARLESQSRVPKFLRNFLSYFTYLATQFGLTRRDIDDSTDSTACWRGYQGTWEIRDGHLYLNKLRGAIMLIGEEPILADWFTGTIEIPKGKMLQYVHVGFLSIFEQEIHVTIANGSVIATQLIDNRDRPVEEVLRSKNPPNAESQNPQDAT